MIEMINEIKNLRLIVKNMKQKKTITITYE